MVAEFEKILVKRSDDPDEDPPESDDYSEDSYP